MQSLLGIDLPAPVTYVIAFVIIFSLLTVFALVLRRLTGARNGFAAPGTGRARQPRLGIVDVYDLDRQRQLILLRRDNVEHLLLIGGPNDVVVENNIVRVPGVRLPTSNADLPERLEPAFEPPPRPVVEPAAPRPEPVTARLGVADALGPAQGGAARGLEAAILTATPQPGPDGASGPEPVEPAPPRPADRAPRPVAPRRPASETEEAAAPRQEPPRQEPPRQEASRQEPPRQEPPRQEPPPRQEVPRPEPVPRQEPAPRPEPARPAAARPAPAPAERGPADQAVLTDVARQLDQALKRPAPAAAPARPAPEVTARRAETPAPVRVTNRPPEPTPPEPAVAESAPAPRATPPRPAAAAPEPRPEPRPAPVRPPEPAPRPEPAPQPAARAPEPAKAEPAKAPDPFSVEEIEAEFARLLGRPLDRN